MFFYNTSNIYEVNIVRNTLNLTTSRLNVNTSRMCRARDERENNARGKKETGGRKSESETEGGGYRAGSWHGLPFQGKGKGTAAIHYGRLMTPREIYRLTASSN